MAFEISPEYTMISAYVTLTVKRGTYEYDLTSASAIFFFDNVHFIYL